MTGLRWTPEQLAAHLAKKGKTVLPLTNPKASKFHSVMTECQGIKFQSKKEARYFQDLQARVHMGEGKE